MPEQLGPLEIRCDAPPYGIVRGCRMIGIQDPEDVAWFQLSRYRPSRSDLFSLGTWKALLGSGGLSPREHCVCGRELPRLEGYDFTLFSGTKVRYLLGQCPHCRTVFWEKTGQRRITG